MSEETAQIVFNISGGNNQVLPNATHAEQHFHYHNGETVVSGVASRLSIYINKVEDRQRYIPLLRSCQSAAEVGRIVVSMVQDVPGLTIDTAKTEPFITILLGLATGVTTGTTVPNFRKAIDNAWFCRKD